MAVEGAIRACGDHMRNFSPWSEGEVSYLDVGPGKLLAMFTMLWMTIQAGDIRGRMAGDSGATAPGRVYLPGCRNGGSTLV